MQRYSNRGGNSNVHSFEVTADSITVMFNDRAHYLYTNSSTGAAHVKKMKQLAEIGRGLNSYIVRTVKTNFARKWR
ncbi:KTSC domain-containing protein [Vibrio crassostreae]|nr:hypothetical protein EDB59_2810 [Vibrio crassostreae]CAK2775165.1 KTSC domain-containing protein [Vibrio crassostreae]